MRKRLRQEVDPDNQTQTTQYVGGWQVREEYVQQSGRHIVRRLIVEPTHDQEIPDGGINSRLLRSIEIGRPLGLLQDTAKSAEAQAVLALFRPKKRRPKWTRNDARFYAELADQYTKVISGAFVRAGREKPIEVLAKARGVRVSLLRAQIHLARKNKFLTKGTQGKAGGELTKKALRVLSRAAEKGEDDETTCE